MSDIHCAKRVSPSGPSVRFELLDIYWRLPTIHTQYRAQWRHIKVMCRVCVWVGAQHTNSKNVNRFLLDSTIYIKSPGKHTHATISLSLSLICIFFYKLLLLTYYYIFLLPLRSHTHNIFLLAFLIEEKKIIYLYFYFYFFIFVNVDLIGMNAIFSKYPFRRILFENYIQSAPPLPYPIKEKKKSSWYARFFQYFSR